MEENAMVVFHGFLNLPTKEKMQIVGAMNDYFDAVHREPIRAENEAKFKELDFAAGGKICFHTDDGITDSRLFLRSAALAVRGGLPREAASFASAINKLVAKSTDLLATQEQMTGIILHEMRRPMTSMMLELERHGGPRPMTLKAELVRLSAITERLLEVARSRGEVERGRLEIVDLAASARRAVEVLSPQAQARGCRLSLTQDGGAPFTGLTGVVDEALVNVVENAIKHSPPHSVVEVSCGPGRSVTISDSGNGLSDEHVERLFQAFERGPTEADGWGLGLMIVKQAVELHGGKVEVGRSRLGGARFTLSFESILAEPPADQARSRLTGAERSERTIESTDH